MPSIHRIAYILILFSFIGSNDFCQFREPTVEFNHPHHLQRAILHELLFTHCPRPLLLLLKRFVLCFQHIVYHQFGVVERPRQLIAVFQHFEHERPMESSVAGFLLLLQQLGLGNGPGEFYELLDLFLFAEGSVERLDGGPFFVKKLIVIVVIVNMQPPGNLSFQPPGGFSSLHIFLVPLFFLLLFQGLELQNLLHVARLELQQLLPHFPHCLLLGIDAFPLFAHFCLQGSRHPFAVLDAGPVEGDLLDQVFEFGPIFELQFVVFCPFAEGCDEVVEEFEGGLDVGVLFGEFGVVVVEGLLGGLVDLLYSGQLELELVHDGI